VRDLAPVTLAASTPNVLVVHPSLKAATVKELIALARTRPGEINFASSGHGTPAHLAGELFNAMAGVKLVHVPYKGAAPALADLLGAGTAHVFDHAARAAAREDGKLRALAVTSLKRSRATPDLPTVDEAPCPASMQTPGTAWCCRRARPRLYRKAQPGNRRDPASSRYRGAAFEPGR